MKKIKTSTTKEDLRIIKRPMGGYVKPEEYVRDTRALLKQTKLYSLKYGALGFAQIIKCLDEWNNIDDTK